MKQKVPMLKTADRSTLQQLALDELPGLYALARRLTGSTLTAEDLVQETLLRACTSFERLRDPAAGPKWLRVIMANLWRDDLRKRGRRPQEIPVDQQDDFSLYRTLVDEDPLPYSDTLHVDFIGAFSAEDIELVLARVPEHFRAVLVLRYVGGFDTREVADLLEMPHGTVYSHLHRGRKAFERALWEYAQESDLLVSQPDSERPGLGGEAEG